MRGLSAALVPPGGVVMAEFVPFALNDGSEAIFGSAESDLVALYGGAPEVLDGGKLTAQLQGVAEAAEEVAGSFTLTWAGNAASAIPPGTGQDLREG